MDNVDRLLKELSNLPGFRWDKSDVIGSYLVDRGYVWQLNVGRLTPSQLLDKLKMSLFVPTSEAASKMLALPSDITQVEENLPEDLVLRQVILSHLIALEAAQNEEVQTFRQDILENQLLQWGDVQRWILIQALQDGQQSAPWLSIQLTYDQIAYVKEDIKAEQTISITLPNWQIARKAQLRYLQFGLPDSQLVHEVAISSGGTLEPLWDLSKMLADFYSWTEAQATVFVLTGLSPLIPTMTAKIRRSSTRSLLRINLDIDPTVSSGEVENLYLRMRSELIGLRRRDMGEKSLHLALFAALRPREEKWSQTMQEWNKVFPQWSYKGVTNFGTEAIAAQRRVLTPDDRKSVGHLKRGRGEASESSGGAS